MAFDVTGLTDFNDEFSAQLVAKAILEGETLSKLGGITLYPNVKAGTNFKLNLVSEAITPRASGCSFDAAGDTVYSQETILPASFQVDKVWCPEDLSPKYVAQAMKGSTAQEDFTESQFIFDLVTKEIKKFNDRIIWDGDISGSADLIDGIITQLTADTDRLDETTIATAETADNILSVTEAMYDMLVDEAPELLNREDLVMVMSNKNFAALTRALRESNLFAYGQTNDNFKTGITIPGTNVMAKPLNGIVGDEVILTFEENLVIVMDGVSDEDKLDVWYSKDNQELRGVAKWTLGAGYHYADQIVTNF